MIEIQIAGNKSKFLPYEIVEAEVTWNNVTADDIKVELLWATKGKGTTDEYTADSAAIALAGQSSGNGKVKLQAPVGPYSFSGKLFSLIWYIVASGKDKDDYAEVEIVIAPEGKEIQLHRDIQVV